MGRHAVRRVNECSTCADVGNVIELEPGGPWYVVEEAGNARYSGPKKRHAGRLTWRLKCRKLASDGTYDPKGRRVTVWQAPWLPVYGLNVFGRMRRHVTFT